MRQLATLLSPRLWGCRRVWTSCQTAQLIAPRELPRAHRPTESRRQRRPGDGLRWHCGYPFHWHSRRLRRQPRARPTTAQRRCRTDSRCRGCRLRRLSQSGRATALQGWRCRPPPQRPRPRRLLPRQAPPAARMRRPGGCADPCCCRRRRRHRQRSSPKRHCRCVTEAETRAVQCWRSRRRRLH